jgi:vacuolar-type H+-ATPase subunit E/Vma4
MALAELLQALENEAELRIEEVRRRGRSEAERIRVEAAAERETRRAAALDAREADLRAAAAREIERARRTAVRRRLSSRAEALERIRGRIQSRLEARADDPALLPMLRAELARALEYAGDEPIVVEGSPGLLDGLRRAFPEGREVELRASQGLGGLVLRAADGSWSVDATFAARLDRAWPRLAIELTRRIEPGR